MKNFTILLLLLLFFNFYIVEANFIDKILSQNNIFLYLHKEDMVIMKWIGKVLFYREY
jgi:hypothetical protein